MNENEELPEKNVEGTSLSNEIWTSPFRANLAELDSGISPAIALTLGKQPRERVMHRMAFLSDISIIKFQKHFYL